MILLKMRMQLENEKTASQTNTQEQKDGTLP